MGITFLYWTVAVLPVLPFVVIFLAYRQVLQAKRATIDRVMRLPGIADRYTAAFPAAETSTKSDMEHANATKPSDIVKTLFDLYYHWRSYIFAIALNGLITFAVTAYILIWAGIPLAQHSELPALAKSTLPTVAFGFAGAYIWNFYDLLRRYRAVDLTPPAFHFSWLRLLVGCVVGPLIAADVPARAQAMIAFAVGVSPLPTLFQYFNDIAKRVGIKTGEIQAEKPTLHNIQGVTKDVIGRLAEENIDSAEALAYSDPFKLFLKTDMEWAVIIDLIDQALLFIYLEDKIALVRPTGSRGCIDLAYLFSRSVDREKFGEDKAAEAEALLEKLPERLKMDRAEINGLCRSLVDDPRVAFLMDLYFKSFAEAED